MTGIGQIALPERVHTKEVPALGPSDRIMTFIVEKCPCQVPAVVEATALQPGETETPENRRVHGSAKLAAKCEGSFVESVRSLGAVTLESNQRRPECDSDLELECITPG